MAQRLKAFVKRSATAVQMAQVGSIAARRPTLGGNELPGMNSYMNENFFKDENFRSIIECLDTGKWLAIETSICSSSFFV